MGMVCVLYRVRWDGMGMPLLSLAIWAAAQMYLVCLSNLVWKVPCYWMCQSELWNVLGLSNSLSQCTLQNWLGDGCPATLGDWRSPRMSVMVSMYICQLRIDTSCMYYVPRCSDLLSSGGWFKTFVHLKPSPNCPDENWHPSSSVSGLATTAALEGGIFTIVVVVHTSMYFGLGNFRC